MIYLKSAIAGLVALVVIPMLLIGLLVGGAFIYFATHPPKGEGSIGWDPISLYHAQPYVWCIPLLSFLAGFIWEYRRLLKRAL